MLENNYDQPDPAWPTLTQRTKNQTKSNDKTLKGVPPDFLNFLRFWWNLGSRLIRIRWFQKCYQFGSEAPHSRASYFRLRYSFHQFFRWSQSRTSLRVISLESAWKNTQDRGFISLLYDHVLSKLTIRLPLLCDLPEISRFSHILTFWKAQKFYDTKFTYYMHQWTNSEKNYGCSSRTVSPAALCLPIAAGDLFGGQGTIHEIHWCKLKANRWI